MNMDCILVFDIGTTSLKSAVFDASGRECSSVSVPYETHYPAVGMAEQDPHIYWDAAVKGVRLLDAQKLLFADRLVCIGLSGHMNGCIAVDSQGETVHPAILHSDSRSSAECRDILREVPAEEIYRRTGNRADEHLSLPKMLWIRNHRPEAYQKTAWFLNSKDYLRFRLTGILGETDYSDGSLTGAMDISTRSWDTDLISALGLSPSLFPSLLRSIDVSGGLQRASAKAMGLPEGLPVAVGGGDAACATRGAGVTSSQRAYASLGSSAWVSTLSPSPISSMDAGIQNFYDLDGKSCNVCGTVQSAGAAVDWAIDLFTGAKKLTADEYRNIESAVRQVPPGSEGVVFLPYLMGERTPHWDAQARGVFAGCSLYHGREVMLRSVYEGAAFALRDNVQIFAELGMPIQEFALLGGGAQSRIWCKIICSVLGKPLKLHRTPTHAASLGAAMAAGVSAGIWDSLDDAADIDLYGETLFPEAEHQEIYTSMHRIYQGMYNQLKQTCAQLAELRVAYYQ